MNEFNRLQMALDPSGLTESCDVCNAVIVNWRYLQMSFLTWDGRIVCNNCRTELLKIENNGLTSGETGVVYKKI